MTMQRIVEAEGLKVETEATDGLLGKHVYSLLQVKRTKIGGHELCQLRNPHAHGEWKGDWSDGSALWTPELKAECELQEADDGIFWMSFADFTRRYTGLVVCLVRHEERNAHLVRYR